jgi:acyl-CoA thioesterase-1
MHYARVGPALRRLTSYGRSVGPVQAVAGVMAAAAIVLVALVLGLAGAPRQAQAAIDAPIHIVALGDSLVAGFGLRAADSFPARLKKALAAKGLAVEISNAGVSGDTATDGLARLDWSVPEGTDAVILELGANDALRGIDPAATRKALDAILRRLRERRIPVLVCGMLAPRNLGTAYTQAFDAIFPELAAAYNVLLYPFFLQGVAIDPALNQRDGMHPSAAGVDVIVRRILPKVEELITQAKSLRAS